MIIFSEIRRCHHPHFTQFFQKAKKDGKLLRFLGTTGRRSPGTASETLLRLTNRSLNRSLRTLRSAGCVPYSSSTSCASLAERRLYYIRYEAAVKITAVTARRNIRRPTDATPTIKRIARLMQACSRGSTLDMQLPDFALLQVPYSAAGPRKITARPFLR